jgi:hypothetical protein
VPTREEIDAEKAKLIGMPSEELQKIAPPMPSRNEIEAEKQKLLSYTREELNGIAYGIKPEKSVLDKAVGGLIKVGKFVDSYGGAPTRSAFSELVRTDPEFGKEEPSIIGNINAAGEAFANQWGKDPNLAPTIKEVSVNRFGVSDKTRPFVHQTMPSSDIDKKSLIDRGYTVDEKTGIYSKQMEAASNADITGAIGDAVLDPLNLIPVGTMAKGAGKLGVGMLSKIPGTKAAGRAAVRFYSDIAHAKISPEFSNLSKIAEKHGIDLSTAPEAVEFGQRSNVSRLARSQAEGPVGQDKLDNYRKFLSDTTGAFEAELSKQSGGKVFSRLEAGQHLRDSYNRSVEKLFDEAENGYTYFVETYPGLKLSDEAVRSINSKLSGIEKYAKGLVKRDYTPAQRQQGQSLLNMVSAARQTNGSFKQTVEELRAIGKVAYEKTPIGQIPPDIEKTRELYSTLRDGLIKTVETDVKDGTAMAGAMRISNGLIHDFLKNAKPIEKIIDDNLAPEILFDRFTKNTNQIDALQKTLSPEDYLAFRSSYMDNLASSLRASDEVIRFPTLRNAMKSQKNQAVLTKLFEHDVEKLKELEDIVKLGESAGIDVLSTSGTGASIKFSNIKSKLVDSLQDEAALDSLKQRARNNSYKHKDDGFSKYILEKDVEPGSAPLFGPLAIGTKEAFGLRLPQQISIKQKNNER